MDKKIFDMLVKELPELGPDQISMGKMFFMVENGDSLQFTEIHQPEYFGCTNRPEIFQEFERRVDAIFEKAAEQLDKLHKLQDEYINPEKYVTFEVMYSPYYLNNQFNPFLAQAELLLQRIRQRNMHTFGKAK